MESLVRHQLHGLAAFLRRMAVAAVVSMLVWTAILMIFEHRFIYFPTPYSAADYEQAKSIPELSDRWFSAEDGVRLHAWYLAGDSAHPVVVMSHGNAGNISHRLPIARALRRAGMNVLLYDYRGYGRSEGSPDEEGLYRDGRAAYDYVRTHLNIPAGRIFLWGTSLGGAVAVEVATQRPAAGLILESTFTSARDMARQAYPFLPVHWVMRSRFTSIDKIGRLLMPVLIIHGTNDSVIPFDMGKRLFAAVSAPKRFHAIVGADHNNTYGVGGKSYIAVVAEFVARDRNGF